MTKLFERRLTPADSPLAVAGTTALAVCVAMGIAAIFFHHYGASPVQAYFGLFHEPFGTLHGFGYALVRAAPLALVALGTIVSWRSGFYYLGFEGCFVIGAAAVGWMSLATPRGPHLGPLFLPLAILLSLTVGGLWAGLVAFVRVRLGGNEVLISLMSNYVARFFLQYLVSGPLRAPGSLPETSVLPHDTWLPFLVPGTRGHAGILIAVAAALLVWALLQKLPLGYELIVTGFNPAAARYAGIEVGRRMMLAGFFAGGLGALAGMVEVLGSQHRLMDGISGNMGFVGIIVALLSRLNPLATVPIALVYGGMSVGADAMQRRAAIPSSITFLLESLAILLVLASDIFRFYRLNFTFLTRFKWRVSPGEDSA
ncbi:MAG TPA: ABC transporter permease [Candidatus Acidoferrales bacterium]|nr:ABC transporter permease [Candidatus Acidoferrales bacterium]